MNPSDTNSLINPETQPDSMEIEVGGQVNLNQASNNLIEVEQMEESKSEVEMVENLSDDGISAIDSEENSILIEEGELLESESDQSEEEIEEEEKTDNNKRKERKGSKKESKINNLLLWSDVVSDWAPGWLMTPNSPSGPNCPDCIKLETPSDFFKLYFESLTIL